MYKVDVDGKIFFYFFGIYGNVSIVNDLFIVMVSIDVN